MQFVLFWRSNVNKMAFFSFVFFLSTSIFAATLKGVLQEKGTRNKLSGVRIFILPHKLSTTTDEKGNFTFENVPEGAFTWVVNLNGYTKLEQIDQTANAATTLYLERITYNLYETVVTSKLKKRDDAMKTLTQEQFLGAPGSGGDPVKAVQNLSGIAQTQSAQVAIEGQAPADTSYMVNQHSIPLIFHFGGLTSVVIPYAVESVDYMSSGFGPEYGHAIGGLIGLNTRSPKADRLHGLAYVDIFNAGLMFEGPVISDQSQSFLFSLRRSYVGEVLRQVMKNNSDFNFVVAPNYSDSTFIYQNKINDKNRLKIDVVASRDELGFVLKKPLNNDPALRGDLSQTTEFLRLIPRWIHDIDADSRFDFSFGFGPDYYSLHLSDQNYDVKSLNYSTRGEYSNVVNPSYKLFLGMDTLTSTNHVSTNFNRTTSSGGVRTPLASGVPTTTSMDTTTGAYALYWRNELKPAADSPWLISPNLRLERFEPTHDNLVQPRLNGRYSLSDSFYLKGATGLYYQMARPEEINPDYGNEHIKPPKALHNMLGFSKDFRQGSSQGVVWEGDVFYKKLTQLVIPSATQNYNNDGTGRVYGLETELKYRASPYTLNLSYTLLKSLRTEPGVGEHPAQYDQTHNLNLISAYEGERWTFAARFRYVTGNPYTPVVNSSYDADNNVFIPVRGSLYSDRLKNFAQLDIRIDRKFVFNNWLLFVYLDVQNVTNHKNEMQINYSYDYSQQQATTGLPILPTFGVRGEF